MTPKRSATVHGLIGGALAATAIALFFLIVDGLQGRFLMTPRFLAGLLTGGVGEVGTGLLVLYTILHYAVFLAVGAGTAWALQRLNAPATALLGIVLGFLLFDAVFYASVVLTGVHVVEAIGWPAFLAANLIGGVVLVAYLSRAGVARGRSWREALAEHRVVREGLIAGLLGALAVAAWFFVVDLALGRVFYTPGALGSALLSGVSSPAGVEVTAGTVLGYTLFHVTGFMAMGLVFAALVVRAEQSPSLVMGLALLFVTFETLLLGLVAILAAWLLEVLPWWSIAFSNLVAAGAMALYLWRAHPHLRRAPDQADGNGAPARAGEIP